ncbi:MAG: hypothetical protein JSS07_03685 [Proteobacteria bacterium]|nr:hypothetical protein [Pseudomonadota bacterium]
MLTNITTLQEQIQNGEININHLKPICGSFKMVAHLTENMALAWNRESSGNALDMFQKENKLLSFLNNINLPAMQVYSNPFKIPNEKYGALVEWIPNSTLFDVKDSPNVHNKLTALVTGVVIPTHEGWVLQKEKIEATIKQKILADKELFANAKIFAKKLLNEFSNIQNILIAKRCLIADLQILVTPSGIVKIIDPIDVVTVKDTDIPNQFEYLSILDNSNQQNRDFIKLLHDGKTMINQVVTWCTTVSNMASQADWIKFLLPQAKELKNERNLSNPLLRTNRGHDSKRGTKTPPSMAITSHKKMQGFVQTAAKPKSDIGPAASLSGRMHQSPEKKMRSPSKTANSSALQSPLTPPENLLKTQAKKLRRLSPGKFEKKSPIQQPPSPEKLLKASSRKSPPSSPEKKKITPNTSPKKIDSLSADLLGFVNEKNSGYMLPQGESVSPSKALSFQFSNFTMENNSSRSSAKRVLNFSDPLTTTTTTTSMTTTTTTTTTTTIARKKSQ